MDSNRYSTFFFFLKNGEKKGINIYQTLWDHKMIWVMTIHSLTSYLLDINSYQINTIKGARPLVLTFNFFGKVIIEFKPFNSIFCLFVFDVLPNWSTMPLNLTNIHKILACMFRKMLVIFSLLNIMSKSHWIGFILYINKYW